MIFYHYFDIQSISCYSFIHLIFNHHLDIQSSSRYSIIFLIFNQPLDIQSSHWYSIIILIFNHHFVIQSSSWYSIIILLFNHFLDIQCHSFAECNDRDSEVTCPNTSAAHGSSSPILPSNASPADDERHLKSELIKYILCLINGIESMGIVNVKLLVKLIPTSYLLSIRCKSSISNEYSIWLELISKFNHKYYIFKLNM